MVCVYCGSPTGVKNSRLQRQNNHTWRRRVCQTCRSIFTTVERPELSGIFMVRKAGTDGRKIEPFRRDKLFLSIYEACKHRVNAETEAASVAQTVINRLLSARSKEAIISRGAISRHTYKALGHLDSVAATLYAAYHKLEDTSPTTS